MEQLVDNYRGMSDLNYSKQWRLGSVTVSNVRLDYQRDLNPFAVDRYFLCSLTLSDNCSVFLSDIRKADGQGVVNFNINYTFLDLPRDFEITLNIYTLEAEPRVTGTIFNNCATEQFIF